MYSKIFIDRHINLLLIEPNDIISRKDEIKGFVATAKLELAVKRCMDFYRDFGIDEDDDAVLLSTTLYIIIDNEKKGQLTQQDVAVQKQQVARRILQIIKDFSNLQLQA